MERSVEFSNSTMRVESLQRNYIKEMSRLHQPRANGSAFNRIMLATMTQDPSGKRTNFLDYTDGTAYTLGASSQGMGGIALGPVGATRVARLRTDL